MARERTTDEIKEDLLEYIVALINEWTTFPNRTIEERLTGLAYSILSTLDGESLSFPKFIVAPDPNREDKQYHINRNKDYYPENFDSNVKCDISGSLHENLHSKKRRVNNAKNDS